MKLSKTACGLLAATCLAPAALADVFTIGTFSFNEANCGPHGGDLWKGLQNLRDYRNDEFTKRSSLDIMSWTRTSGIAEKESSSSFDRSRCVGQLLGRGGNKGIARGYHLSGENDGAARRRTWIRRPSNSLGGVRICGTFLVWRAGLTC